MKKLVLPFIIFLLTGSIKAQIVEEMHKEKNIVSIDFSTSIPYESYSISYERLFNTSGLSLSAGVLKTESKNKGLFDKGMTVEFQYKMHSLFHCNRTNMSGFLSAYSIYRYIDVENKGSYVFNNYESGWLFGISKKNRHNIIYTVEAGCGIKQTKHLKSDSDDKRIQLTPPGLSDLAPRIKVSVGYKF